MSVVFPAGKYRATQLAQADGGTPEIATDEYGNIYTRPAPIVGSRSGLYATVTVTRPSDVTAYTANDVVGPTGGGTAGITFALGAQSASSIMIRSVALMREASAVIASEGAYTLHLYNVTPPSALADNAAFDLPSGDRNAYLGSVAITIPIDLGSTLWVEINNINKVVRLAGTSLFAYLVTAGGYTPASAAVHRLYMHAEQL